jgi:hypothetical protein
MVGRTRSKVIFSIPDFIGHTVDGCSPVARFARWFILLLSHLQGFIYLALWSKPISLHLPMIQLIIMIIKYNLAQTDPTKTVIISHHLSTDINCNFIVLWCPLMSFDVLWPTVSKWPLPWSNTQRSCVFRLRIWGNLKKKEQEKPIEVTPPRWIS